MNIKIISFLSIIICNISYGQSIDISQQKKAEPTTESTRFIECQILKINKGTILPKDSLERLALLTSVNSFLISAQENSNNVWVLESESMETQILIDEIQNIQKSNEFKCDTFFSPYLTNFIPLSENKYIVKLSYIGMHENSAILRANFELLAHKVNDEFLISSTLRHNTQHWKIKQIRNFHIHYPFEIDNEKIQRFAIQSMLFDDKLKNNKGETHYYLCANENDPLKLFGVEYKSDYNGDDLSTSWSTQQDAKTLDVLDESILYGVSMHDLWHHRFSQVMSRKKVHKRVDCHIATLYGGIWGFSWDELFPLFCNNFVVGNNIDWLNHKHNLSHFITNGEHGERKNYTDDFIGALLIKKIENEKGFDGVWKLLRTKRTKDEIEYFEVLESLVGISKVNYNKEVQKLIDAEVLRITS